MAGAIWRGRQSDRLGRQWDESGVGAGLIGLDGGQRDGGPPQGLERVPWHLGGLYLLTPCFRTIDPPRS